MKILVTGIAYMTSGKAKTNRENDSAPSGDQELHIKQFQAAAFAIGKALAEKKHTIIVSALNWGFVAQGLGVARHVVEGANEAGTHEGEKNKVIFFAPRVPEPKDETPHLVDTLVELRNLPNVEVIDRFLDQPVRISYRIPDVKEADAVIVLDGSEGIAQIATAAYSLGKAVVPVVSLGQIPERLYNDLFLLKEYDYYIDRGYISQAEVRALTSAWNIERDTAENAATAHSLVTLAEKLVMIAGQADKLNTRLLLVTVVLTILSILLWVLAFSSPWIQSHAWSLFVVLFLSVWPGVGLRTLISYQQGAMARLTWQGLLVDFGVANVIAFGLALLFLVGNIAFTGELAVNFIEAESSDFTRVAVIMSILGLAAGYLVPLGRLRELLENTLAQQE